MFVRFRATALLLTTLVAAAAIAAEPLTMSIDPAFEGYQPSLGTLPVAVELTNTGPDARGMVRVSGDNYQMDYPVELPRGSKKRLLTYPSVDYSGLRYYLITNQGTVSKPFNLGGMSPDGTATALLISDNAGELAFLRGADAGKPKNAATPSYAEPQKSTVQDAYTTPENAPGRAVGYANLGAVILGTGSERLSGESVEALKLFALTGGTLVFVGGASAPILGDPRWSEVLPATNFEVRNLSHSQVLQSLGEYEPPTISVTTGTPIQGASIRNDGSVLMTAEREFGLGKVVYTAFNPFEPPLSRWNGRKAVMMKVLRLMDMVRTNAFLNAYQPRNEVGPGSYSPTSAMAVPIPIGGASDQDPFSTKLPPTEKVFLLLGAYFIIVVPVNFLVLRRLKRGELAWFTAPVISLGFASAFFASAQDLYSARMSTATQGLLLGQEGNADGMFLGQSQMFIPRSGSYDLKVAGIDSLAVRDNNDVYYYGGHDQDTSTDINPIDVGEIKIPQMSANNLAFKQVTYRQKVPVGNWFSISLHKVSSSRGTCTVTNESPYDLNQAVLYVSDTRVDMGTLRAGEKKAVNYNLDLGGTEFSGVSDFTQFLTRNQNIALGGMVYGFRPGPQLGEQVSARTQVRLGFVAKEALGPK